jgi:hypothetical protein
MRLLSKEPLLCAAARNRKMAPLPKPKKTASGPKRHAAIVHAKRPVWTMGAAPRRARRVLSVAGIPMYTKPGMTVLQQVVAAFMADVVYRMVLYRRARRGDALPGKYHKTTERDFMGGADSGAAACPFVPGPLVFDTDGSAPTRGAAKKIVEAARKRSIAEAARKRAVEAVTASEDAE